MTPEEKQKWNSMPEGQSQQPCDKLNEDTQLDGNTNDTTAAGTSQQASPQPQEDNAEHQNSPNN